MPDFPTDLHPLVRKILDTHSMRLDNLEETAEILKRDIIEIKGMLKNLATKDDINGVLRDALSTAPSWVMVLLVALTGITIAAALYRH